MTPTGWWRRNLWALLALVPVLAIALYAPAKETYDRYGQANAFRAQSAGADGWVKYGDARVRLVDLGTPTDLKKSATEPFQPPIGVRAWRATIEIESGDLKASMGGCQIGLEDDNGRRYQSSPAELGGARLLPPVCTPDDDKPAPAGPFRVEATFALPQAAKPVAVRVWVASRLPSYARLVKD